MPKRKGLYLPAALMITGLLAGRFVWPRQRGLPETETARVVAAWQVAAAEAGLTETELAKRPAHPVPARWWDLLRKLEDTKPADFPALWASWEKETAGTAQKLPALLLLAERWAELDPEAAFAFLRKEEASARFVAVVFRAWARTSPETALAAVATEGDKKLQEAQAAGLFSAITEEPEKLLKWADGLSWLDTSQLRQDQFNAVIPPEALRRLWETDPAACQELAAKGPPWLRLKLEAFAIAAEAGSNLPAALKRIDSAGLTGADAPVFFSNLVSGGTSPAQLIRIAEHLTVTLGSGWLREAGDHEFALPWETMLQADPAGAVAVLSGAVARHGMTSWRLQDSVTDLLASHPELALQLAPARIDPFLDFIHGGPPDLPASLAPRDALNLATSAPWSPLRDTMLRDALQKVMQSAPEEAAAWLASLPEGEFQSSAHAAARLAGTSFSSAQVDLELAAVSAATGGQGAADQEALLRLVDSAGKSDAAGTAQQIAAWEPGVLREAALSRGGKAWAVRDTPAALAWAETLPPGAREHALSGVMHAWGAAEPAAAEAYLASLPATAEAFDLPAAAFSAALSRVHPVRALEWAGAVSEPELRFSAVSDVVKQWAAGDPQAALQVLPSLTGLSDAQRQQLRALIPQK